MRSVCDCHPVDIVGRPLNELLASHNAVVYSVDIDSIKLVTRRRGAITSGERDDTCDGIVYEDCHLSLAQVVGSSDVVVSGAAELGFSASIFVQCTRLIDIQHAICVNKEQSLPLTALNYLRHPFLKLLS